MKRYLKLHERIERLRLLQERRELEGLEDKTPSQLTRLAELDEILGSTGVGRTAESGARSRQDPAAA